MTYCNNIVVLIYYLFSAKSCVLGGYLRVGVGVGVWGGGYVGVA